MGEVEIALEVELVAVMRVDKVNRLYERADKSWR
jgi:hypothetical protein